MGIVVCVCVCLCVCVYVWCDVVWCACVCGVVCMYVWCGVCMCVLCLGYSVVCTLVQNSRQSVYCHSGLQSNHKGDTYRRSTVWTKTQGSGYGQGPPSHLHTLIHYCSIQLVHLPPLSIRTWLPLPQAHTSHMHYRHLFWVHTVDWITHGNSCQ